MCVFWWWCGVWFECDDVYVLVFVLVFECLRCGVVVLYVEGW